MCAVGFPLQLVVWLFVSYAIVAIEKSDSYVEVAAVDVVGVLGAGVGACSSQHGADSPRRAVGSR
jgi:hypothetical protein